MKLRSTCNLARSGRFNVYELNADLDVSVLSGQHSRCHKGHQQFGSSQAKIKQCRHCCSAISFALEAGHATAAATSCVLARRVEVHACGALLRLLAAAPISS